MSIQMLSTLYLYCIRQSPDGFFPWSTAQNKANLVYREKLSLWIIQANMQFQYKKRTTTKKDLSWGVLAARPCQQQDRWVGVAYKLPCTASWLCILQLWTLYSTTLTWNSSCTEEGECCPCLPFCDWYSWKISMILFMVLLIEGKLKEFLFVSVFLLAFQQANFCLFNTKMQFLPLL